MRLKPFFSYYGSKYRITGLYPKPKHDRIIEPFAGSANYALMYHDRDIFLCDIDPTIVRIWDYLINVSEDRILSLPDVCIGDHLDDVKFDGLVWAERSLIGFYLNGGAAVPCRTPSKWMVDLIQKNKLTSNYWGQLAREKIASQLKYIRHWKVRMCGYWSIETKAHATWFIDPPYQKAGIHYKASSETLNYENLAIWCRSRKGLVIVCENQGAKWLPFRDFVISRSTTKNGANYSKEVIWTNDTYSFKRDGKIYVTKKKRW